MPASSAMRADIVIAYLRDDNHIQPDGTDYVIVAFPAERSGHGFHYAGISLTGINAPESPPTCELARCRLLTARLEAPCRSSSRCPASSNPCLPGYYDAVTDGRSFHNERSTTRRQLPAVSMPLWQPVVRRYFKSGFLDGSATSLNGLG